MKGFASHVRALAILSDQPTVRCPLRILHAPYAEVGHAPNLARAERALGLQSLSVSYRPDPYHVDGSERIFLDQRDFFRNEQQRWALLLRAIRDFDVIHFNFGASLFPVRSSWHPERGGLRTVLRVANSFYCRILEQRDLPLLRRLGKAIFVTYQGGDARQLDYCRKHYAITHATEVPDSDWMKRDDELKRQRIASFAHFADGIYALNPDLLNVLPPSAQFLPYAHISLDEWKPDSIESGRYNRIPQIVHAPTDRLVKGTRFIVGAVERLRQEGFIFDFRLIEGVPNAQAKTIYKQADLLIDQLLLGWYGGAAAEFMALGKPVIAYIRDEDLVHVPPSMRADLPVLNATPSTIYDVLRSFLSLNSTATAEIGLNSRRYMERWHDPRTIAGRLKSDYERAVEARRTIGAEMTGGTRVAAP